MSIKFITLLAFFCFLFIIALSHFTPKILAEGTYSDPGTTDAADCSPDCITWAQSPVWVTDKYGKFIITTQNRTGPTTHFLFSNDEGATWTQSTEGYGFLTRASMAYDTIDDVLHLVWSATDSNDGIIYRRYSITRDGSNNITSIQRMDAGVNLQLDTSSSRSFEHPVAIWKDDGSAHGSLVAIWGKSGTNLAEVRASMRQLSMTNADGTAGNWTSLDGTADTFSTDPPAVEADKIYGSTTTGSAGVAALIRGGSGAHKNDLYIFPAADISGGGTSAILGYRMDWNAGSQNWSGGTTNLGTIGQMQSSLGGNTLKWQLLTKPVLDTTNDRLYIGWPRWKAGGDGDTVSFASLDSSDTVSSTVDVYSALGAHSYAPTIDLAYDNTGNKLYISYVTSTTNGANGSIEYKTYDGSTLSSATTFYTSPGGTAGANGGADIPVMMSDRHAATDRIFMAFRVNGDIPPSGAQPHTIRLGYIQLSAPTPTPSPTPSPSPSAENNSLSQASPGSASSPSCNNTSPSQIPDLFQVDTAGSFVRLHFTTTSTNTSGYEISYGTSSQANQYSDNFGYNGKEWILNRTISSLQFNSTYFFKIRATNGCTAGQFSQVKQIKTKGKLADITSKIASLNPFSKKPSPTLSANQKTATSCIYQVQSGDSLWKIAQNSLGSGSKFREIMTLNPELFGGNLSSFIIKTGWQLKIC